MNSNAQTPEPRDRDSVGEPQSPPTQPDGTSGDDSRALVGSATGALAGAIAAFVAALCCVGPSTVALFGAGGALAAARLKPCRPYFLSASLALIVYGFWRAYSIPSITAQGR